MQLGAQNFVSSGTGEVAMNEVLTVLHLFGFAGGVAASIGNMIIMQAVSASPANAPILGKLAPIFSRVGQVGLAILWITGAIMIWAMWQGPANLPGAFWIKLLLVIALTAIVITLELLARRMRTGDKSAAARMPLLGRFAAVLVVLIVISTVVAFR